MMMPCTTAQYCSPLAPCLCCQTSTLTMRYSCLKFCGNWNQGLTHCSWSDQKLAFLGTARMKGRYKYILCAWRLYYPQLWTLHANNLSAVSRELFVTSRNGGCQFVRSRHLVLSLQNFSNRHTLRKSRQEEIRRERSSSYTLHRKQ